jgi:hypothetical protein
MDNYRQVIPWQRAVMCRYFTWRMVAIAHNLMIVVAAILGKVSFLYLLVPPAFYAVMYFYIRIFIWDKRRPSNITLSRNVFRNGDVIATGGNGQTAIVLNVKSGGNSTTVTVFPFKQTQFKIINAIKFWYINLVTR